jgi:hypothetical protein
MLGGDAQVWQRRWRTGLSSFVGFTHRCVGIVERDASGVYCGSVLLSRLSREKCTVSHTHTHTQHNTTHRTVPGTGTRTRYQYLVRLATVVCYMSRCYGYEKHWNGTTRKVKQQRLSWTF